MRMEVEFDRSKIPYLKALDETVLSKFPEFNGLLQWYFLGSGEDQPLTGAGVSLINENVAYKNTGYYYSFNKPEDRSFIHFTRSVDKLFSIIESRSIWLNTINNTNDSDELLFAALPFGYSKDFYKKLRKEILFFSFCTSTSKNPNYNFDNANNIPMWTRYGNKGKGIIIRFEIKNDPEDWYAYHMSRIKYGDQQKKRLMQLKEAIETFNQKNPKFYFHAAKLFGFHKTGIWDYEDEVRLIYNAVPKEGNIEPYQTMGNSITKEMYPLVIHAGETKSGEDAFHIALPLPIVNSSSARTDYLQSAPQIHIVEIILGYGYEEDQFQEVRKQIIEKMNSNLGYAIQDDLISISKLKGRIIEG